MMDLSSVIDAGLVLVGGIAVLLMGLSTLSAESSTVSTSGQPSVPRGTEREWSLPKAA